MWVRTCDFSEVITAEPGVYYIDHHCFGPEFWQVIKEARSTIPLHLAPAAKQDRADSRRKKAREPAYLARGTSVVCFKTVRVRYQVWLGTSPLRRRSF